MLVLPAAVFLYRQEMVLYLDNVTSAAVCVHLGDEMVEVEVSFAGQSTWPVGHA